jgi:hypothetical protein
MSERKKQSPRNLHRPSDHRWDGLWTLGSGLLVLALTLSFFYLLGYLALQPQTLLQLPPSPWWKALAFPVTGLLVVAYLLGALCVWVWQSLQTRKAKLETRYTQRLMESSKADIDRQSDILQAMEAKIESLERALSKAIEKSS